VIVPRSIPATPDEKRRAVDQVLASQTFNRCEQLKSILSYVCTKDLEGRSEEITEYLLGVEALGRSDSFSPDEDSSVRSRAHALRKKLQEYYLVEAPEASLRIDLPRGSYRPQYIRGQAVNEAAALPTLQIQPHRWQRLPAAMLVFAAGMLLTLALGYGFRRSLVPAVIRGGIPAVVKEAWGPLLDGDEVLVVIATPAQLFLRDYDGMPTPTNPAGVNRAGVPQIKQTPDILSVYRERQPVSPHTKLLFYPNQSSPLWGDVEGAMSAVALLAAYRVSYRVLPERLIQPYMLRNRNVLLFGRAEYSDAVRLLLTDAPFAVEYNPEQRSWVVRNRSPKSGEPPFYKPRMEEKTSEDVYGLLTVLPGEAPAANGRRIVIFSGVTTAGAKAAEEFFATPDTLNELKARFRRDGLMQWPRAWQLVLKTRVAADATLPMGFRYEAYRVLEK
jgi:hypothetical protein